MMDALTTGLSYGLAVALAAAPLLIIAMLVATTRPPRVSASFVAGWAVGILASAALFFALADTAFASRQLSPTAAGLLRIGIGALLAVLAVRSLRTRGAEDDVPPKFIARASTWSAPRALAIGAAAGALNPKNLAIVAAGASAITGVATTPGEHALAAVALTASASIGIAAPLVLHELGGPTMKRRLNRARAWMEVNGTLISTFVLAVLAVLLIVKGFQKL